jgi:hypothetical protein
VTSRAVLLVLQVSGSLQARASQAAPRAGQGQESRTASAAIRRGQAARAARPALSHPYRSPFTCMSQSCLLRCVWAAYAQLTEARRLAVCSKQVTVVSWLQKPRQAVCSMQSTSSIIIARVFNQTICSQHHHLSSHVFLAASLCIRQQVYPGASQGLSTPHTQLQGLGFRLLTLIAHSQTCV